MVRQSSRLLVLCLLLLAVTTPAAAGEQSNESPDRREARRKEDAQKRAQSLRKIAAHLEIGPGRVIADIGAGNGRDTWIFADIVGAGGKVFAEEIDDGKTKAIEKKAEEQGLSQVKAVLGTVRNPSISADSADMAFMHHVYHHLSEPREMLQGIWEALKPGGYLVIVDRKLGTLVDWVPREKRTKKHYWIAETTVVREAREQGFLFVDCLEQHWHAKEAFVLVFQRPAGLAAPDRDPDAPSQLPADTVQQLLPPAGTTYGRVAFVALGEGRKLICPILETTSSAGVDIVLEEWATQKDERPPLPGNGTVPSVLTESGDPHLSPEPIDAVYFLDSYHLLFHGPALLAQLRPRLTPSGCVYVLDRQAPAEIPHREASHRRMIAPETVKKEMAQAAFTLLREEPRPTDDRFLLVFGKTDAENGPENTKLDE